MDLALSPEHTAFRDEVRAFIAQALPPHLREKASRDAHFEHHEVMEWHRILFRKGWAAPHWPVEYGGPGFDVTRRFILQDELERANTPGLSPFGLVMVGPAILQFGTEDQKRRFLPKILAGEEVWCQGYSEPNAGSDLASLKTRAVRDGDRYVVNGQKIWNSYADAPADFCLLLARTNPEVKKQLGISMFLVDMRTPGITVRPIPSMAGKSEFSEIFFDDAVIPVTDRIGDEDAGWTLVGEGLAFERIGIARYARANRVLEHLVQYARDTVVAGRSLAEDPAVRTRLATLATRIEAAKLLNYGAISIQAAGEVPAIEASIARIHNTQVEQLAGQVGLELLGPQGLLTDDDEFCLLDGEMQRQWLESIPVTVAAGTTEVQKNIIAQRGLGLPRSA